MNDLFPGREDYTGPTTGCFGLLHHDVLWEESHDVMGRMDYVKREKPASELAIRLHNMIYLGGCPALAKHDALNADYDAKCNALYADYLAKRAPLEAEILAYIRSKIPDCPWNGTELVFKDEEKKS